MNKKIKFSVAVIAAAGFSAPALAGETDKISPKTAGFLDEIKSVFQTLNDRHEYTVAGHSSHQSHGSHGSHSSHRSYYKPPEIDDLEDRLSKADLPGTQMVNVRNDRSTPSNSILPGSPAITKKLKPLPGNSTKFKDVVTRAQLALLARGYDLGTVDGRLDAKTMAALYKLQNALGMPANGKLTPEVLTALNVSAR
jgi:His-Xaa-Ser repeat protein HxsA